MKDIVAAALEAALSAGASYADARVVDSAIERVSVRGGRVDAIESSGSLGLGVRVLAEGAWGFAATSDLSMDAIAAVGREATAIARASARVPGAEARLADLEPVRATWSGGCERDPFAVPLEEKLALLLSADELMHAEPRVRVSSAQTESHRYHKLFGSSEGALIEQSWTETGAGIAVQAVDGGEVVQRSYPNSMGGQWAQGGWEVALGMDLLGHAPRIAEEAAQLLAAEPCPAMETTVIIDSSQLALQVHESVGHPTELDRVLGDEAAFAGTSWVSLGDIGSLRYGSDLVTIVADATTPGSLGSFGYDDEGVPAQRDVIVEGGVLSGFMMSRESALAVGRTSNGCMRADGWGRVPLVRMTTVSLEPGEWSLDDLIADTESGLYLETNSSWSIDDRRLNFQFACEYGRRIRNGELAELVRNPNYTGITPQFWRSCDAICSDSHWLVWGLPNCGKGEPVQAAHVGHGAAPARFRDVRTGVGR